MIEFPTGLARSRKSGRGGATMRTALLLIQICCPPPSPVGPEGVQKMAAEITVPILKIEI